MKARTPTRNEAHSGKNYLVAVAGNPNCGKTTIFNGLTGLRHRVGNYPGVTVEKREGVMTGSASIRLLDLPGTYSLSSQSLDERIAGQVLLGHVADTPKPDAVLVVVDVTNLERNLYLASQIIELGLPVVIACNMMDLLARTGYEIDVEKLSALLGAPVIPTVAHRGKGITDLRTTLETVSLASKPTRQRRRWSLAEPIEQEVRAIASAVSASGYTDEPAANGAAILLLSEGGIGEKNHLPDAVRESLSAAMARLADNPDHDLLLEITRSRYTWLNHLVAQCLVQTSKSLSNIDDRLDRIFTHKAWGMLIFMVIMATLFYSIFALAHPIMTMIETGIGLIQDTVARSIPAGGLRNLIHDGLLAGVGNVLAFFPQICILFLFLAILEDTGYMARSAFLMNRIMSRVGLHGKSFIPLLSCHACAIPGIMATRTIENARDRLATVLVAPLMCCSARLPVFTVLIAACLPGSAWTKAALLLSMYVLGIVAALAMASIFKKTLLTGPAPTFLMELPPYHVPRPGAVLRVMWDRSKLFLTRAGTLIMVITIALWALMDYPKDPQITAKFKDQRASLLSNSSGATEQLAAIDHQEATENLRNSYAGRLGGLIEPVIKPLGYDWRIGIGLISSFAAREVFIGTMGIALSIGEGGKASIPLREQIHQATWPDGSKLFTPAVALGLMVFYVLACQCFSTLAVIRQETNSLRWPLFVFTYMSILAYGSALLVYQTGSTLKFLTQ